jgi:hypothetical protein
MYHLTNILAENDNSGIDSILYIQQILAVWGEIPKNKKASNGK